MSGLKYCTKQAKKPYYISEIDINVYSIEEICYFLYNYIYVVERGFFNKNLVDYIGYELGLSELSGKLNQMLEADESMKEMILLIFKSAMYYNDAELNEIIPLLGSIEKKGVQERLQLKADSFFLAGNYEKALTSYFSILQMKREVGLSTEFYANIYFSIGVIYGKFFLYDKAIRCFASAFELQPYDLYLKYMVTICLLDNNEEELLELIRYYNISDEVLVECRRDFAIIKQRAGEEENEVSLENMRQSYIDMLS